MVEILQAALISKVSINNFKYSLLPWNRALNNARSGRIDAVIAATEGEAEGQFLPNHHIGITKDALYIVNDSFFEFDGIESLIKSNAKLGLITEYEYSDEIETFKKTICRQYI